MDFPLFDKLCDKFHEARYDSYELCRENKMHIFYFARRTIVLLEKCNAYRKTDNLTLEMIKFISRGVSDINRVQCLYN
jgi:hypothetical protein